MTSWTLAEPDKAGEIWAVAVGFLLIGAFASFMIVRRLRSRGLPFLVLSAHGFTARNLDRPIAWHGVYRVNVVAGRATITVFALTNDATMPVRTGGHRVRIGRRRRTVTLNGIRPRGMTVQSYYTLILTYLSAARASAALAARASENESL